MVTFNAPILKTKFFLFHSFFRGKKELEISLQWSTVSKHPNTGIIINRTKNNDSSEETAVERAFDDVDMFEIKHSSQVMFIF